MDRDRWDERLENWALWAVSERGSSTSEGVSGIYAPSNYRTGYRSKPPPPINGEALDTAALVDQLCEEHLMAVRARYIWRGPEDVKAQSLGIHPDTLRNRVKAAKERLEELDQVRRRGFHRPPRVA